MKVVLSKEYRTSRKDGSQEGNDGVGLSSRLLEKFLEFTQDFVTDLYFSTSKKHTTCKFYLSVICKSRKYISS